MTKNIGKLKDGNGNKELIDKILYSGLLKKTIKLDTELCLI